jgi:2-methylcitrate dehydratase PrpD
VRLSSCKTVLRDLYKGANNTQTPQQAQFSLPYALACVALHGRVKFEDLLPENLRTAEKLALMGKVRSEPAADLSTDDMREKYPESARLTVLLTDGRSATGFCGAALGMPDNPQTDADLIKKFETAVAYAGHSGEFEARLGQNPAHIFARFCQIKSLETGRAFL